MLTKLISPTHQKQYTLEDIFSKGLIRSGLTGSLEVEHQHTCFYGSKDFYAYTDLSCTASLWSDSVCFNINGIIPVHTTEAGKLEYGFQCGCDTHHGGQFPQDANPDNPDWENYKNPPLADITFWTSHFGEDTSERQTINLDDIAQEYDVQKLILKLIETFMARQWFIAAAEQKAKTPA